MSVLYIVTMQTKPSVNATQSLPAFDGDLLVDLLDLFLEFRLDRKSVV